MVRAERDAKLQHMTEEHMPNMSILQFKQNIAVSKLATMERSHTPSEQSNAATILAPSKTSTLTTTIHALYLKRYLLYLSFYTIALL